MKDKDQATLTLVEIAIKPVRLIRVISASSINVTVSDYGKIKR